MIPVPFYLIQITKSNILFDTGMNHEVTSDPQKIWGYLSNVFVPQMSDNEHLLFHLKEIGLKSTDIDFIILSHLQFDQAGGLKLFPNAKVFVQKDEFRYALYPDSWASGYFPNEFNLSSLQWESLESDQVITSGITVIFADGHSPGSQTIVVDLPQSGTIKL